MRGQGAWLGYAGALVLAVFAGSLLVPPATVLGGPNAGLLSRLFPGVPAWWVCGRLALLALGVGLLCRRLPVGAGWTVAPFDAGRVPSATAIAPWAAWVAAGLAGLGVLWAVGVGRRGAAGQLAYLGVLAAPALLLVLGTTRRARGRRAVWRVPVAWAVAALIAVWIVARTVASWHSVRAADAVDLWLGLQWITRAATETGDLITGPVLPGLTTRYMLFQGLWLFGPAHVTPTFQWLQAFQLLWTAVAAAALARVAAVLLGGLAPVVAAAVFLWSPFVLLMPLSATPFMLGGFFAAVLLALWLAVDRRGSAAALVALATTAGFTITLPPVAPIAALACALSAWSLWRRRDGRALVVATALMSFAAAVLPTVPSAEAVTKMVDSYTLGRGEWAGLEAAVLGQRAPLDVDTSWAAGRPGRFDIALGSVLAPFAIPRTALRLWGDALFDPLGTVFAAVGVGVCVCDLRRRRTAVALLALFGLALAPGAIGSSFDRPSLTRMFLLPVPMALLAVVGFEASCRLAGAGPGRGWMAVVAVVGVVVGGTVLFDVVTPRLLASSAVGIALRAVGAGGPPGGALFLRHGHDRASWLHLETIAAEVGAQRLPVQPYRGMETLVALEAAGDRSPEVLLWSPGLEAESHVGTDVCARWPGATLYTLTDAPGLSRLLAARPAGEGWTPGLPAGQWRARQCGTPGRDGMAASPATADGQPGTSLPR